MPALPLRIGRIVMENLTGFVGYKSLPDADSGILPGTPPQKAP